jgi:hypothetical protein
MLNWAARYYPIVRILKTHGLFDDASLLEIGSGPAGIGRYRKVPFVGCDLSFAFGPEWPMTPITASAAGYHRVETVYNSDVALKSYLWAFGL